MSLPHPAQPQTPTQKLQKACFPGTIPDHYYAPNRLFYDDPKKPIYQDDFRTAWDVSTPAAQGIDPKRLAHGVAPFNQHRYMLSLLIFRNNALIFERYFHGAARHHSHNIHSASKSLLSGVLGVAFADKRFKDRPPKNVATRITSLFPKPQRHYGKFPQNKWMEVWHLLTMTAGYVWDENKSEKYVQYQPNWVHAILSIPHIQEVGEYFIYSSGNAHLVSAVIQKKTGMNTCVYAHQQLFSKIGVDMEYWGQDPQGISTGGFNIFVTPRELARFGLLYLNEGRERGRQIIPKEWIIDSLDRQVEHVEDTTDPRYYHYGYFWWETQIKGYKTHLAWGYRAQFILLIPSLKLMVVSTSDTRDYNKRDADFDIFKFVGEVLLPAIAHKPPPDAK